MPRQLIYWTTVANPKGQKIPLYMRKAAYHPEEKEVYLPAAGTGESEMMVQLFAINEEQTVLHERGHAYVPASWIKKLWPKMKGTVEQIEARIFSEMEAKGL
jgi:hypothetical protein